MKFKLTIDCDNAAFEDNGTGAELHNILVRLANRLANTDDIDNTWNHALLDSNGNTVGRAIVTVK